MDPPLRMPQSRPGTMVSDPQSSGHGYRLLSIPTGTEEEWLRCSVHLEGLSVPVIFLSSLLPLGEAQVEGGSLDLSDRLVRTRLASP